MKIKAAGNQRFWTANLVIGSFLIFSFLIAPSCSKKSKLSPPPETRQDNVKDVLHGVEIVDPYRWLEDQQAPETREWIDRQNEYTHSLLDKIPGRDKLRQRLEELMRVETISVPIERNGRYFFTRRAADQDLPIIYMREGLDGEDQVLIDPHQLSPDHTISVQIREVSGDGRYLVYSKRRGGEDEVSLHLLDVDRRSELPDSLPRARYFGVSFAANNLGFYYTRHGKEGSRVYFHRLGSRPEDDRKIFGDGYGPDKIIFSEVSEDGRHLLIHVLYGSSADQTEIHYQNLARGGSIVPVIKNIPARFYGTIAGNHLYVQTNWQAPKKRILRVPLSRLTSHPSRWQEIVPESDSIIEGFSLVGGKLFVNYLENVVSHIKIFTPEGQPIGEIELPAMGSVSGLTGHWKGNEAFFSYSSFLIPTTIYRYDVSSGEKSVWAKLEVPIDSEQFEVKQVWYFSKDSTRVPMFLVHRKGLELNGKNPTLLTGYGGFNISLKPGYSSLATIWVENGGVFARPSLRGGGEFGEEWHKAGMREKKQNVFDDFIAAAEWLIDNKYTHPEKLAISGGSNGGLLVGAALTQRPDLFKAVACFYPLLDMIRYHKFLVARFWIPEYGSSDDPEQFQYLLKYSPYHNVKPGTKYPAVIFITGDGDTRVAPLHARKMAALLQNATGSDNPVLLLYDTKAGHSGGMPVSKRIEDMTNWLSFLMWQLGM